ncbi:MAG: LytTR family transcriptional regulator DNA-binding domain-containing protein [Flavobacteriales bacterium]|nr:LytTR family transcriptional regulator DNA-binding domain-containing protein [Flavobacteriales bacterium]
MEIQRRGRTLFTFIIILGLSTVAPQLTFCQQPQPTFRHYTVEDGLPSSEVYHVIQDSRGYIWFATDMGVSRFDGYEFQNMSLADGLPDNTVFNIYEDYRGRIWFIPFSGQLSYYEGNSIHEYEYNDTLQKVFTKLYKSSFYIDKEDNIYIGVNRQGYLKITGTGQLTIYKHQLKTTNVYDIIQMDSVTVFGSYSSWVAPKFILNIKSDRIRAEINFPGLSNQPNSNCIIKENGTILFTADRDLIEIQSSKEVLQTSIEKQSLCMTLDKNEHIWLGARKGGVLFFKNGLIDREPKEYLAGLSISSILHDSENSFWFTTLEDGVYYMRSNEFLSYNESNGFLDDKVECLATDGSEIIFAGLGNGIIHAVNSNSVESIELNSTGPIRALLYDQVDKTLLIGTVGTDYYVNEGEIHKSKNTGITYDFVKGRDNSIWIGHQKGVSHFPNAKAAWLSSADSIKETVRVDVIFEDFQGAIWTGNLHGLWRFENNNFDYYGARNDLLKNRITDIAETINHDLCLATRGAGILIVSADSLYQISARDGLLSDNVQDIFVDSNVFWLATNRGLNKITFHDGIFNHTIESFTTINGLVSNEVNQVLNLGKEVWVATDRGLTVFKPDQVKQNVIPPPIYITGITVLDEDTLLANRYSFDYDQNYIGIRYTGLSYINAGKLQYTYKMDGLDSNWIYTTNTSVRYAAMPPGNYTFRINAINEDGFSSEVEAGIQIIINPPFWRTRWFRISCLLIALAGIYASFKIRILTYNRDVVRELLILLLKKFRRKKYLVVNMTSGLTRIDPDKVLWIKAENIYVDIVTIEKNYLVRSSLKAIEQKLPEKERFMRVHRSYIISTDKVKAINSRSVLINDVNIPVGYNYRIGLETLKAQFQLMKE